MFGSQSRKSILIGIAAVSLIALPVIACSNENQPADTATATPAGQVQTAVPQATSDVKPMPALTAPAGGTTVPVIAPDGPQASSGATEPAIGIGSSGSAIGAPGYVSSGYDAYPVTIGGISPIYPSYGYSADMQMPTGLWITGNGQITVKPDVAILSAGVEVHATTVASARDQAAAAMQAIVDAAKANGVAADDISTQYFNIYPEYRYIQVQNPDGSYGKQELIGYVVNNTAQVKVTNIDNAGIVLDAISVAGGDNVRVNNIQFTVSDPSKYAIQMRQLAAQDAMAKAKVYADAFGVNVGGLVYLSELSTQAPVIQKDMGAVPRAALAEGVTTPISADTMTLTTSIQVVFSIAQ